MSEIIDTILKEFNLSKREERDLFDKLSGAINYLIENDFAALVQLLYRKDIDESKLREMLALNSGKDAGLVIARLIIERESEKIQAQRSFKSNDDIPEDEKW